MKLQYKDLLKENHKQIILEVWRCNICGATRPYGEFLASFPDGHICEEGARLWCENCHKIHCHHFTNSSKRRPLQFDWDIRKDKWNRAGNPHSSEFM